MEDLEKNRGLEKTRRTRKGVDDLEKWKTWRFTWKRKKDLERDGGPAESMGDRAEIVIDRTPESSLTPLFVTTQ